MFGSRSRNTRRVIGPALLFAAGALVIFTSGRIRQPDLMRASQSALRKPACAPRWKLAGPKSTLINPRRGPDAGAQRDRESDMSLNALMTFYFPEIF